MACSSALIGEAKRLQRLQTRRASVRRDLKRIEDEIKLVRRNLRGLASVSYDAGELDGQLPPDMKGRVK